jgi:hypothetical protein
MGRRWSNNGRRYVSTGWRPRRNSAATRTTGVLGKRSRSAALARAVACCCGLVLLFPALASAQAPQPVAPADGYQHVAGSTPPTFVFAPGSGNTDYLWVHVSKAPVTASTGVIGSDVTLASFTTAAPAWTPTAYTFPSYWLVTPGTYYWQPYRISFMDDPDGYQEGAIRRFEVVAPQLPPPPPPPPTTPAPPPAIDFYAGLSTEPIPRYVGRQARGFRYSVSTDGTPPTVGAGRWAAIARRSGSRWGMRQVGTAYGRPYSGDGSVEVGWGWLPRRSLGLETDRYRYIYKVLRRPRWICNRFPDGRRSCRWGRRKLVRSRLVDADLIMNRGVWWQPGPAYPSDAEIDLETVVLHEMGHLAGNAGHARRCRTTPMVESLATGEWWRSSGDWYFKECGFDPAVSGRRARVAGVASKREQQPRFHVKHVVRVEEVNIGAGRSADEHLANLDRLHAVR